MLLLNASEKVSAIMVHLPLPAGVDTERIQALIDPDKDVEGVNPANIGNVVYGRRSLVPCTALAAMEMIESTGTKLPGACCVCVGASNIVGKPVVVLLMRAEATVISTNVHTVGSARTDAHGGRARRRGRRAGADHGRHGQARGRRHRRRDQPREGRTGR